MSEMTSSGNFSTKWWNAPTAGLLLDVNNIYVSSKNHNFDPFEYVKQRARRARRADP